MVRGKKYNIDGVETVKQLQTQVEEHTGLAASQQGVLFGGKKLKPSEILEEAGVEEGSLLNIVPVKKKAAKSTSASTAAAGTLSSSSKQQQQQQQLPSLKDQEQLQKMVKDAMDGGKMPDMGEAMDAMKSMMQSPLFQEFMNDPEQLEKSRQQILSNPMMKNMMASMPGMEEVINSPEKWKEAMQAAANLYSDMPNLMEMMSNNKDLMNGMGGMSGMFGAAAGESGSGASSSASSTALDELSEDEEE